MKKKKLKKNSCHCPSVVVVVAFLTEIIESTLRKKAFAEVNSKSQSFTISSRRSSIYESRPSHIYTHSLVSLVITIVEISFIN